MLVDARSADGQRLARRLLTDLVTVSEHDAAALLDALSRQSGGGRKLLRSRLAGHQQRGDLALTHDNLQLARDEYEQALKLSEELTQSDPSDARSQRDLSVSLTGLGDVSVQLGDLKQAQTFYTRSLAIDEKLAQSDPSNAESQRDLITIHIRLSGLWQQRKQPAQAQQEKLAAGGLLAKSRNRLRQADAQRLDQEIRSLR